MSVFDEIDYLSKITNVPKAEMARFIDKSPSNFHNILTSGSLTHEDYLKIIRFLNMDFRLESDERQIYTSIFYRFDD